MSVCLLALSIPLKWSPYQSHFKDYLRKLHDTKMKISSLDEINLLESDLASPWTMDSLRSYIKEKYIGVLLRIPSEINQILAKLFLRLYI